MSSKGYIRFVWPGLQQINYDRPLSGLLVAILFSLLFNSLLITTLIWPELLSSTFRTVGWGLTLVLWATWTVWSARHTPQIPDQESENPRDEHFRLVIEQYLKRNWVEAEHELRILLSNNPLDVDARMLLVSLLRRTGRIQEAKRQLDTLQLEPGSAKWALEIARERQLIAQAEGDVREPAVDTGQAPNVQNTELSHSQPGTLDG